METQNNASPSATAALSEEQVQILDKASYICGTQGVERTPRGQRDIEEANRLRQEVEQREVRQSRGYTGAHLAALFKDRPYLQSFKLKISEEDEYDDQGYYKDEKLTVSEVCLIEGVSIPGDLAEDDIAEDIEVMWGYEGYEVHSHLFTACEANDHYRERRFHFDRSAIEPILSLPLIDGNEVFEIFFPGFASPSALEA